MLLLTLHKKKNQTIQGRLRVSCRFNIQYERPRSWINKATKKNLRDDVGAADGVINAGDINRLQVTDGDVVVVLAEAVGIGVVATMVVVLVDVVVVTCVVVVIAIVVILVVVVVTGGVVTGGSVASPGRLRLLCFCSKS